MKLRWGLGHCDKLCFMKSNSLFCHPLITHPLVMRKYFLPWITNEKILKTVLVVPFHTITMKLCNFGLLLTQSFRRLSIYLAHGLKFDTFMVLLSYCLQWVESEAFKLQQRFRARVDGSLELLWMGETAMRNMLNKSHLQNKKSHKLPLKLLLGLKVELLYSYENPTCEKHWRPHKTTCERKNFWELKLKMPVASRNISK